MTSFIINKYSEYKRRTYLEWKSRGKSFANWISLGIHFTKPENLLSLYIMGNEVLQIPIQMFCSPWKPASTPWRAEDSSGCLCTLLLLSSFLYHILHYVFICFYYWSPPDIRANISPTCVNPGTAKCQAHSRQSINNIELNFLR